MSRAAVPALIAISLAGALAGCATSSGQTAGGYASNGAHAVSTTGGDVYAGVGTVAKKPFRDLNMMQDPIPPVLIRAETHPYDVAGLDSCDAILNKVAQLDLALGPDLDLPKDEKRDRASRAATLAAAAAIDAAASAAEGFLPMRSVIRQVTGATSYDEHVKRAVLAGTERRAFLKAVGMQHNCSWPAAPLGFQPVVVAIATSPLAVPPLPTATILYARGGVITARDVKGGAYRAAAPIRVASLSRATTGAVGPGFRARPRVAPSTTTPPALGRAALGQAPISSAGAYARVQAARLPAATARPWAVATIAPTASSVRLSAVRSESTPAAQSAPSQEAGEAAYPTPTSALVGSPATSPSAAFAAPWSGSALGR